MISIQYLLIVPPLASWQLLRRRGIESTSLLQVSWSIFVQICCIIDCKSFKFFDRIFFSGSSMMFHIFSITLRSSDEAGHFITGILFFLKKFIAYLGVWAGALSCMNRKRSLTPNVCLIYRIKVLPMSWIYVWPLGGGGGRGTPFQMYPQILSVCGDKAQRNKNKK